MTGDILKSLDISPDQIEAVLEMGNKRLDIVVSNEGYITVTRTLDVANGNPPQLFFVIQEKGDTRVVLPPGGGEIRGPGGTIVVNVRPGNFDADRLLSLTPLLTELALASPLPPALTMLAGAHVEAEGSLKKNVRRTHDQGHGKSQDEEKGKGKGKDEGKGQEKDKKDKDGKGDKGTGDTGGTATSTAGGGTAGNGSQGDTSTSTSGTGSTQPGSGGGPAAGQGQVGGSDAGSAAGSGTTAGSVQPPQGGSQDSTSNVGSASESGAQGHALNLKAVEGKVLTYAKLEESLAPEAIDEIELLELRNGEWIPVAGRITLNPKTPEGVTLEGYLGPDLTAEKPAALDGPFPFVFARRQSRLTVAGRVQDQDGTPIQGATVLSGQSGTMSGAEGSFSIEVEPTKPALTRIGASPSSTNRSVRKAHSLGDSTASLPVPITATKSGYASTTLLAETQNSSGNVIVLLPAPPTGTLTGLVTDSNGNPIAGLKVLAIVAPGYPRPRVTPYLTTPYLMGEADDAEDGKISSAQLAWGKDKSTPIAVAHNNFTTTLDLRPVNDGLHAISLTAADSHGHASTLEGQVQTAYEVIVAVADSIDTPSTLVAVTGADGRYSITGVPLGLPVDLATLGPFEPRTVPLSPLASSTPFVQNLPGLVADPAAGKTYTAAVHPLIQSNQCLACHGNDATVKLTTGVSAFSSLAASCLGLQELMGYFDGRGQGEVYRWLSSLGLDEPPTATITAPAGGSYVQGERISFSAQVSDPKEGACTLSVTWTSDKDGLLSTAHSDPSGNLSFSTNQLTTVGVHTITLTAEDAVGNRTTSSVQIEIKNFMPLVSIVSPQAKTYGACSLLPYAVTALDPFDDEEKFLVEIEDSADGILSDGPFVPTVSGGLLQVAHFPTIGDHTLSVTVRDTQGAVVAKTIDYTQQNSPPVLQVFSPAANSQFELGQSISFYVRATDPCEDVTKIRFKVTSSIDGVLYDDLGSGYVQGQSAYIYFGLSSLSSGEHLLTFRSTDGLGAYSEILRTITVVFTQAGPPISVSSGRTSPGFLNYVSNQPVADNFQDTSFRDSWWENHYTYPYDPTASFNVVQENGGLTIEIGKPQQPLMSGSAFVFVNLQQEFDPRSFESSIQVIIDPATFGVSEVDYEFFVRQSENLSVSDALLACGENSLLGTQQCQTQGFAVRSPAESVSGLKGRIVTMKFVYDHVLHTLGVSAQELGYDKTFNYTLTKKFFFGFAVKATASGSPSYVRSRWTNFQTNLTWSGYVSSNTPLTLYGNEFSPMVYVSPQGFEFVFADNAPVRLVTGQANVNAALASGLFTAANGQEIAIPFATIYSIMSPAELAGFLSGFGGFAVSASATPIFVAPSPGSSDLSFTWNLPNATISVAPVKNNQFRAPICFMAQPISDTGPEDITIDNLTLQRGTGTIRTEDFSANYPYVWYVFRDDGQYVYDGKSLDGLASFAVANEATHITRPLLGSPTNASNFYFFYTGFGFSVLDPDQQWKLGFDVRLAADNTGLLFPLPIQEAAGLRSIILSNFDDPLGLSASPFGSPYLNVKLDDGAFHTILFDYDPFVRRLQVKKDGVNVLDRSF